MSEQNWQLPPAVVNDTEPTIIVATEGRETTVVATPATRPQPAAKPARDAYEEQPAMPFQMLALLLIAVTLGAFAATIVLPAWLPGLSASLLGSEPKAYWHLARSSGFVAYGLLWLAMALGLMMTNKLARAWPGGPTAFDLHQHASLLGLAFALFHGLILIGDDYIGYDLAEVLIPFTSSYETVLVGLGQVGFYLLALVGLSFYVRSWISRQGWRLIHFLSFATFVLALIHGVTSGTDSGTLWAQAIYWFSGVSLLWLTIYRILTTIAARSAPGRSADTAAHTSS